MEQFIIFNGVRIVLTTAESVFGVQNFLDQADAIISVYPDKVEVLLVRPRESLAQGTRPRPAGGKP